MVTRELALTLSESCARPRVVKHTPGVANNLADFLGRLVCKSLCLKLLLGCLRSPPVLEP